MLPSINNSLIRAMVGRTVVFLLAVLLALVVSRAALGQGTTTTTTTTTPEGNTATTTTTTYEDGAAKSQDTVVTHEDGSKYSDTDTEYDEDGRPTSETKTIYDPTGRLISKHTKTWVYDDKGRLTYFETSDESYGDGVSGGYRSGYRVRMKYKDDKDTEGTTTSEQINEGVNGKWRDFDGDGGDVEPSKEPLQPAPPKKPKKPPLIPDGPIGEEPPASSTKPPEQPKTPPPPASKPKEEAPPEKPKSTTPLPSGGLGEEPHAPGTQTPPASGGNTSSTAPTEQTTIAIAMPANAEPGDTISGTATDEPTEIAEMQEIPGIHITLVPVTQPAQTATMPTPQENSTAAPQTSVGDTLAGVVVQVNGKKEPADKPLVATLGPTAEAISLALVTNDSEARVIGQDSVPVSTATTSTATATETSSTATAGPTDAEDYEMPPVSKPGAVEVIHGATSGNTNDMQITVDGEPAKILTTTPRSVLWRVPADMTAGAESSEHTVVFTQKDPAGGAPKSVSFPLYGVGVKLSEGSSTLHTGQTNPVQITVSIPPALQASQWQSGTPPADLVNLKTLEAGKSGVKPPKPNEEGSIVVLIEDLTPEVVRLGKKNTIVLQLHQKDFVDGTYTYNTTLDTIHAGAYVVRSRVLAFVKDAPGQASMSAGN